MKRIILSLSLFVFAATLSAQDAVVEKIIEIGKNDNQTTEHLYTLTSRFGGRTIGSDAYDNAADWVAYEFKKWGLEVSVEEAGELPVGFNRGKWSGRLLGDVPMNLHFVTPAYTSGTRGVQKGAVLIEPRTTAEFDAMKYRLKGAWVLIGGTNSGWPVDISPMGDSLRKVCIAANDSIVIKNREIEQGNYKNGTNNPLLELKIMPGLFYRQMVDAGILGVIQSSEVPLRSLYDRYVAFNKDMNFEKLPTTPDIKLDRHQYDVIYQMVKERRSFELEFDIRNHFKLGPVKYNNVIGKIKGSKYPDEYVMVSGHLDALDSGTGAVDCGVGVTPAMEAARMLMKAGAKPERSILFVMFAGEEFGLLGAQAWCERHKAELPKISNLFNRDGGPTPPVGLSVPKSMVAEFEKVCKPISSIHPGIPFAVTAIEPYEKPKGMGGHDGSVFQVLGIPAIGFQTKDVLGYNFSYGEIWHTENDIFNKSIPEYQEHTSTVTAIVALGVANMSKLLPRNEIYK